MDMKDDWSFAYEWIGGHAALTKLVGVKGTRQSETISLRPSEFVRIPLLR